MVTIGHFCAAAAMFSALTAAVTVQADQPYIGEVRVLAFDFCPAGWAPLNGQLLQIADHDALFALIGNRYGGDGQTTFALPAAKPLYAANGAQFLQCISLFGVFPARN